MPNLYFGGKHRIGGRHYGTKQYGSTQGQGQPEVSKQRHNTHGQGHRHNRQSQGVAPPPEGHRCRHFHARAVQRNQHGYFGQ